MRFLKLTIYFIVVAFLYIGIGFFNHASAYSCASTAGGGNWSDSAKWTACNSTIPQTTDTVQITNGNNIVVNQNTAVVISITIDAGAILSTDNSSRIITIGQTTAPATAAFVNNGTFTAGNSSVVINKNLTMTVFSGTFTGSSNKFNNLTFSPAQGSSGKTYTGGAAIEVGGNFTINPTGSTSARTLTYNMGGANTITGTFTLQHGSNGVAAVGTGNYNLTAGTLIINAAADSLTAGAANTIEVTGTSGTPFTKTGTFTPNTSTFKYTGNYGSGNTNVAVATYYNLYLDNASETYIAAGDITVSNVLTINAGTFDASSRTITLSGTTGTPFVKTGTFTASTSQISYTGNAAGNTNIVSTTYYNLYLNAAETFDAAGDITVSNVLTINAGTFDAKATTVTLSGTTGTPFVKTGTFTASTSTIKYTGNAAANTNVVSTTYYNLYLDNAAETFDAAGDITVGAVLTLNAGAFSIGANTVTLNGTVTVGTGTLTGGATSNISFGTNASSTTLPAVTLGTLKINRAAGISLAGALTVTTLTIGDVTSNSIFYDGGYQVTSTGTLNLASGTFKLGNSTATTWPAFATRNITAGTTVEYASTQAQTISSTPTYPNLTLSGASTKSLGGATVVNGNLTISAGTLDVTGANYGLTVKGNWSNSGAFTAQGGTVTFNSTTATQTLSGAMIDTSAFYNLTIANTYGADATDNERTSFVPGIDFNAAAKVSHDYAIITASVRVEYESGATYEFANINWNGGGIGTRIFFRNSAASGTWLLKVTGTQTAVSFVNVSRSNASVSGGSQINGIGGNNYDAQNNTYWLFLPPPTEFTSIVDPDSSSGRDYSSLSAWNSGVSTDLTAATTQLFSGTITSTIADNATVYLCRTGAYQTHSGTVVHAAATGTQILIDGITGSATEASGDIWYTNSTCDSSNYFTLSGSQAGGNSAIAIASVRSSNGTADTTAVTITGWTTSSTNYIKIWSDPSLGNRHNGKWDAGKYRLEVSSTEVALNNYEAYVWVDGLQISVNNSSDYHRPLNTEGQTGVANEFKASNNILKLVQSTQAEYSEGLTLAANIDTASVAKIWNNIVYDITGTSNGRSIFINDSDWTAYIYNNTIIDSTEGIYQSSGSPIAKNNIVKGSGNTNAYVGTFASGTDYNATDGTDAIGQGSNNKVSRTFAFVDETNDDFHLSLTDAGAKDIGTNLQADANLPFSQDIDGSYRGNAWDIGADEVPTDFVSTVMQSAGDYATLSAWEADVNSDLTAATTRVYSGSLTSTITDGATLTLYRGGVSQSITATLAAKTSTQILLTGISGTTPLNVVANDQWRVDSSHYWTVTGTLDALGASPIAVAKIDGAWTAADTTAVNVDGWTTSADNYIKIYTTTAARHNGKWDDNKYRLTVSNARGIDIVERYVRIVGLQIYISATNGDSQMAIRIESTAGTDGRIVVDSSIIRGATTNANNYHRGISLWNFGTGTGLEITNNIIYDFKGGSVSAGILTGESDGGNFPAYVYNNTIYNSDTGFYDYSGSTMTVKNNISYYNIDNYNGTFNASSSNNLSGPSQSDAPGSNPVNNATVQFVDAANKDFHLASTDTAAKGAGTNLYTDSNLAVTNDVDSAARPTAAQGFASDIGADQTAIPIYRSIAPSADSALATDNSHANTVALSSGTATFSAALSDSIGVGDAVLIDTGGTDQAIDASDTLLFISARTDSTHYTLQTQSGTVPSNISSNDTYQIYRAYTSLAYAEAGTKNTSIPISFTGGNRDILANNEQWNIAAYANGTTADTTAVTIDGWTTAEQNYIKVYTPVSTSEVGTSQRHAGKWDDNKYKIYVSSGNTITIQDHDVILDGLQIGITGTSGDQRNIDQQSGGSGGSYQISNNIIKGVSGSGYNIGIYSNADASSITKIWNNIIYNVGSIGMRLYYAQSPVSTAYVYNNTVYNNSTGFNHSGNTFIAKNNIAYNNTQNYYTSGSYDSGSANNLSGPSQSDAPGSNPVNNATVQFVDVANGDFHLAPSDTAALDAGANPFIVQQDNFNRSDANPIGGNWTTVVGENAAKITSNAAEGTVSGQHNAAYWNANVFSNDQYSQVKIVDSPQGATVGPIVRSSFSADTYYVAKLYVSNTLRIEKFVNGNNYLLVETAYTGAAGDILKLQAVGNILTVYVNGMYVTEWDETGNSPILSGSPGIKVAVGGSVDDWQGGDVINQFFTDDIDGQTRRQWDIGADEGSVEAVATVMAASGDYSTLSSWESGMQTDLTSSATAVFSGTRTSTVADNATIYLCRSGAYQSITGASVHASATQALVESISSLTFAFTSGDVWYTNNTCNSSNYFTLSNSGNPAIATAKIDGAWTIADTTAITISGWTTGPNNYIRIYTTAAARHNGKWDTTKYRLTPTDSHGNSDTAIIISTNTVKIDGLQISSGSTFYSQVRGISSTYQIISNIYASNNIIKGDSSGGGAGGDYWGIGAYYPASGSILKVWNNIIYGYDAASHRDINVEGSDNAYIYNNTLTNCTTGIYGASSTVYAKNNIVQNCTDGYNGTFNSASDHNISSVVGDTTGGANDKSNTAVVFIDATNKDFHLSSDDTSAKDAGADLSADASLAFSTDIDSDNRGATWDIGADQTATAIYRSVGPSATDALATGASNAVIISGITATFASALPDNVGVGDAIQYDSDNNSSIDSVAFISGRTSSTVYTVKKADGTAPIATSAADQDWSIFRAYTSLSNAETGTENTGISDTVEQFDAAWSGSGGKDIVASNEQWNIACYANGTTPDSTAVTIDGWTTGSQNYIKVYTPVSTSEVGTSQRHQGKWDGNKYNLTITAAPAARVFSVNDSYVRFDGLQVGLAGNASSWDSWAFSLDPSATGIQISNSIIKDESSRTTGLHNAITQDTLDDTISVKIWNNIIYGFASVGVKTDGSPLWVVYNNTMYNCGTGYYNFLEARRAVFINNIAQNCTDGFSGNQNASSDYNISDLAADAPGSNSKNSTTVSFVDANNKDFHLQPTDTAAKNAGVDLSRDSYLPFDLDIDGENRSGAGTGWDIGADESRSNPDPVNINRNVQFKPGTTFKAKQ